MVGVAVLSRHGRGKHNDSNHQAHLGNWAEHKRLREELNHNQYSSALTLQGVTEAQLQGPYLHQLIRLPWMGKAVGFVSPQLRAIETAREWALPIPWEVDHRLRERYWGEFEQKILTPENYDELQSFFKAGLEDPYIKPHGGESIVERYGEMEEFFADMDARYNGETLVLSGHGEMMQVKAMILEGQPLSRWGEFRVPTPNCQTYAYSRINPETGEMTDRFSWKMGFCATVQPPDWIWHPV
jgi:broad specificity phosphatase PhoE